MKYLEEPIVIRPVNRAVVFLNFLTVILSWPTYPLSLARRGGSVHPLITSPSLRGGTISVTAS